MTDTQEQITVKHELDLKDGTNLKEFTFSFNGYTIWCCISGEGDDFNCMLLEILHEDCKDGFQVRAKNRNGSLRISLNHHEGKRETTLRSYQEWIKLEGIENSLKVIGQVLKGF